MEISEEPVDGAEAVARGDEDVGVSFERADDLVLTRGAFEEAKRGCADGDDAPAAGACGVEALGGGGIDAAPLAVDLMLGGVLGLHRQEGAGADV